MTQQYDVVIAGGGPAGLATAERAARAGRVLVVHRDEQIGLPVRTSGGSWRRQVEALGMPPHLYQEMDSASFFGPNTEASFKFADDRPVIFDVTETYRYLAKLAVEAGAHLRTGTELLQVIPENDLHRCIIRRGSSTEEVIARFVVDATGYKRTILDSLGHIRKPDRFGVGAEYEFEDRSSDRTRAILFVGNRFAPSGYGWVFPTRLGTVRVGIGVLRPDSDAVARSLLDQFVGSDLPDRFGITLGSLVSKHTGILPADGPQKQVVFGSVVGVGDSVGQALPNVGEGIRYCIESGRKAGDAIAGALNAPQLDVNCLLQYERWWSRGYYRAFLRAHNLNQRWSGYGDDSWDRGVRYLAMLDGPSMAALLRMEFTWRHALRLMATRPNVFMPALLGRIARRFGIQTRQASAA